MGFYGNVTEPKEILRTDTGFLDALKISLSCSPESVDGFVWVCPQRPSAESLPEGAEPPPYNLSLEIPPDARNALVDASKIYEFTGSVGSSCQARTTSGNFKQCFLVGCGDLSSDSSASQLAKAAACIAALVKTHKLASIQVGFEQEAADKLDLAKAFLTSFLFNLCPDDLYKSGTKKVCKLDSLWVTFTCTVDEAQLVNHCRILAKGQRLMADLIDAPANYCNCQTFAEQASKVAKEAGLECNIMNEAECDKLKMGLFLGVAKGSRFGARLVHLTYRAPDFNPSTGKKVAFVGKGITMDTGGYNIKTDSNAIKIMKIDMGAGASLIGTAYVMGHLKPKNVEVHFIVPACENMVSEDAYRPGDVLTASNGKTVEIGNTDAEGRLVLADGMVYAERQLGGPGQGVVVDFATLTGAAIVALGPDIAAVYGNHGVTTQKLLDAFQASGDEAWKMPLYKPYGELLKSKISDLNNIGGAGKGGSITAALFLENFVSKKTKWCHIDAPLSVVTQDIRGTGFGVAGLYSFASSL